MDIGQKIVAIETISKQCCKRKKYHSHRYKYRTKCAQGFLKRCLNPRCPLHLPGWINARRHTHHRRCRAKKKCVNKDRQHLNQSLFNRMADICRSRCIRCRTDSGFVGIKPTADTLHHSRTRKRSENRLEIKRFLKNTQEHFRHIADIDDNHNQSHTDICKSHHRHKRRCHLYNTASTAKQTPSGQNCQNPTNDPWTYLRIIKRKSGKCRLQIVGCQHIESKCISQDHGNTKHDRQWSAMQRRLNIISRTTIAFPILSLFLVNLCQRTFNQCRRTSNDRNHPHPEYRTKSPNTNCR